MNENDKSRSGLQTAVDFAHAARAAKRIMQAAAVSGVHGAAAATAREAFPLLLKILIAALVVFIVVPMVIFTALPNIFFGYNSSGTDTVIQMTQQAMTLGGVYMTLGNFEGAQIDSVVTGIAAEYEKNGTTIDHIVVSSAMTDDDLLWVIAINSAAHQQDLNTMSADLIRDFCKSSLSYTPSLSFMDSGDDGVVTTLRIEVKHLDPEKLMDELGFDDEARQWAGALYETLEESDAINKYRSYYVETGKLTVTLSEIDTVNAAEIINLTPKKRTLFGTLLASAFRSIWTVLTVPGQKELKATADVDDNVREAVVEPVQEEKQESVAAQAAPCATEDIAEPEPADEELNRIVGIFKLAREQGYTLKLIPGTPEENAPVFDFEHERILRNAA